MKTQEQIIDRDGAPFWRMQWETTLPNSITLEQWNEIKDYIDEKTLEFIVESKETRIINK
jgi:hypothetical protein